LSDFSGGGKLIKAGIMEELKNGRMEEWKNGIMEYP
jgi:hypothetical protein